MNLYGWIVLGAFTGYVAGLAGRGPDEMRIAGHVAPGIAGALAGGFLTGAILGVRDPIGGPLDLTALVISVACAVVAVGVVGVIGGPRRTDRGPA